MIPKAKPRSSQLLGKLERDPKPALSLGHDGEEFTGLTRLAGVPIQVIADTSKIPRLKRFRFQLLHHWLVTQFAPCRAADIGGGKGLLSYLLNQDGWNATLIDPVSQPLPEKYKDIDSDSRVKIPPSASVPAIPSEFQEEMSQDFDLLIGMHAHGCNVKIIDAAARYGCGVVLLPCCVIDEPFFPPLGVHWLESLAGYALQQGHSIYPIRLNFKGQNIGLVMPGKLQRR